MKEIEGLTGKDLFGLDETQREEVIKASVDIYIQQVELGALLTESDFLSFLKRNISQTEHQINKLTEEEQYETCYFLQEVLKKVKEEHFGL
jgi:hypothetical protein